MVTQKQEAEYVEILDAIRRNYINKYGEGCWWELHNTYDDVHFVYMMALDYLCRNRYV